MIVLPFVTPATAQAEYPGVRVSALSLIQAGVGRPVAASYQIDRYRVRDDGTPEDAPPAARVSGSVQIGLAALAAEPALAAAVEAITGYAVAQAVAAGLLDVK